MNVDIRQIQENDLLGYHACLDSVARERRFLVLLEAPPVDATRSWVLSHISQDHPLHVIKVDDQIIGWCDITPLQRPGFTHRADLGIGLYLDYRGQGLGARLLGSALAHAQRIGLRRIDLTVRESNQAAIHLYHKSGFSIEGNLKKAIHTDSGYENIVMMALLFDT